MTADRARVSHDPSRKWRGLIAQQGRVTVEADWNEAATIGEERDRQMTLDVVGPVGTPNGGYAVTPAPATDRSSRSELRHFTIGKGTLYLGGERLDLDAEVKSGAQPDWLDHSTDPLWEPPAPDDRQDSRHELVYLLASEQEVSAVEDPALADVALGGPDTMQRRRILQHFVRHPSESGTCQGARSALESSLARRGLKFHPASMMAESAARLQVSFAGVPAGPGVSQPGPAGGYLGAENQMIRVMVTSVEDGVPTIVWGFDDASFLYRVQDATAGPGTGSTTLTLASAPVDSFHYPVPNQAVELLRDAVMLTSSDYIASATGPVSVVTAYEPDSKKLVISGRPGEPSGFSRAYLSALETPQPYLRVWQATAVARAGQAVPLGDTGAAVTLTSDSGHFHVGDFWRFALRPIQPAIVYPERYLDGPQPPDGPRTWACPLAVLTWHGEHEETTASSCVPQFSSLAERGTAGCCTIDVRPEDVEHGAALQTLLDGHAHHGPITVCLEPGTYTLPAPLKLGPEFDGLTLEACREGVVLRAADEPTDEFAQGLVSIRNAASITIRGVRLSLPHVRISLAKRLFSCLTKSNEALLGKFSHDLRVAIGISAHHAAGLTVENCAFDLPDPGHANSFGAGIFATGAMDGIAIPGCTFHSGHHRVTDHRRHHRQLRSSGQSPKIWFNELTTGNQVDSTHQLSFGYLQVPTFRPDSDEEGRPHRLDDGLIEDCIFRGITVPALAMAHLGALRVNRNMVCDAYGGFWFVSLADPDLSVMFDRIAGGDAAAYQKVSGDCGGAPLLDRIFVIATAIGQVLPEPPRAGGRSVAGAILTPDAALLALARQTFSDFYTQATGVAELPDEIDVLFTNPDAAESEMVAEAEDGGTNRIPREDHDSSRRRLSLRLDLGDCEIDARIGDSNCGAGLLFADFTARAGSVLIHGNRIRSRFPAGETMAVMGVREACISGNIVANDVHPTGRLQSYSLCLAAVTKPPAVAITGNVFIDDPRQCPPDPELPDLSQLNTVIPYVAPASRSTPEIGLSVPSGSMLRMRVANGTDARRVFDLHPGELIIGREEGSEIQLEDRRVSHNHAIVRVRGEKVTIADLRSTNGTKVNDATIKQETPLAPGDQIDVGGVILVVERHEAASSDH